MLNHLGIIMDGNGRWAESKGLSRLEGHREGVKSAFRAVEGAIREGIPHLSLYAFSTENFYRPKREVVGLLNLFQDAFDEALEKSKIMGARLRFVGNLSFFDENIRKLARTLEDNTALNKAINVYLCFGYGGRREIVDAVKKIISENLSSAELDEEKFKSFLYCPEMPDLDCIVRTANEFRLSNFLLWHAAYAEFIFLPKYWPDFNQDDISQIKKIFSSRERRFGRVVNHVHTYN
jgi:undecaprenyl diphosphate synthase